MTEIGHTHTHRSDQPYLRFIEMFWINFEKGIYRECFGLSRGFFAWKYIRARRFDSAGLDSAGLDSSGLDSVIYHKISVADPNTFQTF